jgi:hypothetical protein
MHAGCDVGFPAADVNGRATVSRPHARASTVAATWRLHRQRQHVSAELAARSGGRFVGVLAIARHGRHRRSILAPTRSCVMPFVQAGMRGKHRSCATVLASRPVEDWGRCHKRTSSYECFPHELAVGDDRGFDPDADIWCSSCSRWRTFGRPRPPDDTGFAYGNDALARGWFVGCASGRRTARWDSASARSRRRETFACRHHRHVTCGS